MRYKSDQAKPMLKTFKKFPSIYRNMSRLFPYKSSHDLISADVFGVTDQASLPDRFCFCNN